ncbi:MAG: family 20 glycosylhydrolase [Armatimonadota bacterium]
MHPSYRGPLNIVPCPRLLQRRAGRLSLSSAQRIVVQDDTLLPLAEIAAQALWTVTHKAIKMTVARGEAGAGDILLSIAPELAEEHYRLQVDDRIVVQAGAYAGLCHGLASLLQSVVRRGTTRYVPCCHIEDAPYAGFRGLMVDVARQPHTVTTLKQLITLCWYYKIRYLQLHLSDVEAFTFPSKAFPKLATPHNCLSLESWRELEGYATARGVTIIPELDVPGHAGAGLKRLCPTHPRTGRQVINPVSERTFQVLDTLIGEMCDVFKATPFFHIGADEVAYEGWAQCSDCARELKRLGLADLRELYRLFIARMRDIVTAHGKRTVVWEGFHREGVTPIPHDVIVQFFDVDYIQPEEAMALGHPIINSCWGPLYVCGPHATCPVDMIYKWHPAIFGSCGLYAVPDALDGAPALGATTAPDTFYEKPFAGTYYPRVKALPEHRDLMLGSMLCTWGQADADELPSVRRRLPAMSERIWHPRSGRSFAEFSRCLDMQDARVDGLLMDVRQAGRPSIPGMMAFVRTWRVSPVLPPARLRDLAYPAQAAWTPRTFAADFCDRHAELFAAGEGLVYYACRLRCDMPMRLAAYLGYDGPVNVWVDGERVFQDLYGANPAKPDKACLRFTAETGEHEILVALDANHGNACGIFLRFQRQDRPDLLPELVG